MKRNNMADMHKQFFILVKMLRKDGHDPLAIAGCMLALSLIHIVYQCIVSLSTLISISISSSPPFAIWSRS